MFGLAVAGLYGPLAESRAVARALAVLSGWGVAFSAWLTYVEVARLHAICRYCVTSAGLVSVVFVLSVLDLITDGSPAPPQ
jgi:uncharacterized membrane protein